MVIRTATYTLKKSDNYLEVNYTATGECIITIPDNQRLSGRTIVITDTGESANTNNIILKDSGSVELFRINEDRGSISLKASLDSTKWYIF